jgi:acetyl-CoA synthetase (ADP-forming)
MISTAQTRTLSEAESKLLVASYGVPVPPEELVATAAEAAGAAARIGFPVVLKVCGEGLAHKTERGLVRLNLVDHGAVERAAAELLALVQPEDGPVGLLVGAMVHGHREFIAGVHRDENWGACVMLGVGGIFAEVLADVAFRLVPASKVDADELIEDLRSQALLGPFRGEPAVDRSRLTDVLVALSALVMADDSIVAVDLNPLIVADEVPIAVDALVEVLA